MENFNNYSSGFDSEYSNADNITTDNITITTELDTETDEVFDDDSGNGTILFIFTAVGIGGKTQTGVSEPWNLLWGLVIRFCVKNKLNPNDCSQFLLVPPLYTNTYLLMIKIMPQ